MMSKDQSSEDSKSIRGINIDDLRKPYELPHHWDLRREFIKIYLDKYEFDRLICLSNLFVNIECMGLSYPEEVEKTIKELGSKVRGLQDYKNGLRLEEPEEEPKPRKFPQNPNNHYNRRQRRY